MARLAMVGGEEGHMNTTLGKMRLGVCASNVDIGSGRLIVNTIDLVVVVVGGSHSAIIVQRKIVFVLSILYIYIYFF